MKKMMAMVLAALLMMAFLPAGAEGAQAEFTSTQSLLDALDADGIDYYEYNGIDSDGDEWVTVPNDGDNVSFDIECFFCSDNELCSLRIWNFIDYDAENYAQILEIVNDINASYRYVSCYADTSDNSVTVSMDVIIREDDNAGDIVYEGLAWIAVLADEFYEQLSPYAI